jgi:ABC-type bacteriocin/lantibiotic exporter with double-glycine peptidase domain
MLVRAASYGQQVQSLWHGLQQVVPYLSRLSARTAEYEDSVPAAGDQRLRRISTLTLKEATLVYRDEIRALDGVSLSVQASETIGIVGPSGSGKSTLMQVLLRMRAPTSGGYLVNGQRAEALDLLDWQSRVAYLPQEPHVFRGTVAENIRFFRPIDDDAVVQAAMLASVHRDILAMPDGYSTVIGQRADAVSGGQRQRICLARALAGQPEMLVLDEPTSALDHKSESLVQSSLEQIHGSIIMFIIAHRFSTLAVCDRIIALSEGKIEVIGTWSEVLAHSEYLRSGVGSAPGRVGA